MPISRWTRLRRFLTPVGLGSVVFLSMCPGKRDVQQIKQGMRDVEGRARAIEDEVRALDEPHVPRP